MRPGWAAPREATQKGRDQSIIFPRRRLDASQRGHEVTKGKGGKLNSSARVFPTFANIQENGRMQGSMVMNERQNTIKLARARRQKQMAARRRRTSVANEFIQGIIDHKAFGLIMALFTVFALFGDDIRLAMCQKADDDVFFAISTVTLLAFFGELMLTHFARSDYTGGFYFWLDFVAMLSIIPDIGWIWEPLTGTGEGQGSDAGQEALKAGRASRAGTRAGRLVRIIRLVRLVRLVKLYKVTVGRDDEKRMKQRIREQPSKVGEKMSEMTTRRVIMMVLTLILILPFFDGGLEERINQFQAFGINRIHHMPQDMNVTGGHVGVSTEVFRLTVEQYAMFAGKLLYLEVYDWPRGVTDGWLREMSDAGNPDLPWRWGQLYPSEESITSSFRSNEVTFVSGTGCFLDGSGRQAVPGGTGPGALPLGTECRSRAAFDKRSQSRAEATLNMVKTLFIMVVLSGGAMSFSRIAQTLVIGPIERMMKLVKMLARNPLASTTIHSSTEGGDWSAKAGYETLLLENTLAKIGALMQVGFGAAGAEIIGKNMGSGELDPMVPGKKIIAIYGFSDIRQFTDTTECLQEEVMVFVNKLGGIVHGSSHDYYGMANKNVGDAFLVSWKVRGGHQKPAGWLAGLLVCLLACWLAGLLACWLAGLLACWPMPMGFVRMQGTDGLTRCCPSASLALCTTLLRSQQIGDGTLRGFSSFEEHPTEEARISGLEVRCPPSEGAGAGKRLLTPTELAESALTAFLRIIVDVNNANTDGCLTSYRNDPRVIERFGRDFKVRLGDGDGYTQL